MLFPSHNRLIGFSDFDHYWYYINGGNDYQTEFSDPLDFDLTDILSPAMQADHNFIGDLRAYLPVGAKIGIPAENLANGDGWALKQQTQRILFTRQQVILVDFRLVNLIGINV